MAYEIFGRRTRRLGSPAISFNKNGIIGFNKAATVKLKAEAVENVLVLWDSEHQRIAVRRIGKKDARSYHITFYKRDNGGGFSAKTFLDHIGFDFEQTRNMPVIWNEDEAMFEAEVPADCLKGQKQQKLISVEPMGKTAIGRK